MNFPLVKNPQRCLFEIVAHSLAIRLFSTSTTNRRASIPVEKESPSVPRYPHQVVLRGDKTTVVFKGRADFFYPQPCPRKKKPRCGKQRGFKGHPIMMQSPLSGADTNSAPAANASDLSQNGKSKVRVKLDRMLLEILRSAIETGQIKADNVEQFISDLCERKFTERSGVSDYVQSTWFIEVHRTRGDFRDLDADRETIAQVQVTAGPLRKLRHLCQGNIHQLEYHLARAFDIAATQALTATESDRHLAKQSINHE